MGITEFRKPSKKFTLKVTKRKKIRRFRKVLIKRDISRLLPPPLFLSNFNSNEIFNRDIKIFSFYETVRNVFIFQNSSHFVYGKISKKNVMTVTLFF